MIILSQKYKNFIGEPIGDKAVTAIPGINEILGMRLIAAGFPKAYTVFGQYLLLKKNGEQFKFWLKDICNASSYQAAECCNSITTWCEEYFE